MCPPLIHSPEGVSLMSRFLLQSTLFLLALPGLSSCTSFYVPPPVRTATFEEEEELQTTFYRGESGSALRVDLSLPSSDWLPDDSDIDLKGIASFQLYDHIRDNKGEPDDQRDQTEFDAGIGFFIHQDVLYATATVGMAAGEINADYTRIQEDFSLPFPWLRVTDHSLQGTYIRPWIDMTTGLILDPGWLPVRLDLGVPIRLHAPFFVSVEENDPDLDSFGLVIGTGFYARCTLFDLIAVEWSGGIDQPLIGSDWNSSYETFGFGLILGR